MKLLIKGGTGSGKTYKAFEIAKKLGTYMYLAPTKMLAYESFIEYGGDNSRINTSSVKVGAKNAPNYFGCYASVGRWYKAPKPAPKLSSEYKNLKQDVLEDFYIISIAKAIENIIHDHYFHVRTYETPKWESAKKLANLLKFTLTEQPKKEETYASELHEKFAVAERKRQQEENYKQLYEAICNRIPNFFAYSSDKSTYKNALESAIKLFSRPWPRYLEPIVSSEFRLYSEPVNYIKTLRAAIDALNKNSNKKQEKGAQPNFDTIIIDEAHWASQNDNHAYWIKKVVNEFKGNIILVTAEDINPPLGFETLELEGFHVEGTVEYGYSSWINNIQNSRASLAICSSLKDAEYLSEVLNKEKIKHNLVYRGIGENELIKSFFDFKERGGVLVATNMAQQGINLPCDNLLIELNDYDTTVSISQKIGRVGRRGYTKSGDKNRIFVYDGSGDRSVPKDSTIESYKQFYKCSIKIDWNQHDYNHDDVPPVEYRDHDAEMLLKLFVENNRISNAQKCA